MKKEAVVGSPIPSIKSTCLSRKPSGISVGMTFDNKSAGDMISGNRSGRICLIEAERLQDMLGLLT